MDLTEKTLESSIIYDGAFLRLRTDRAKLPNGRTASREVVEHPGGVAILPLDEAGNVILVEQYRYPLGKLVVEVPAGKLNRGEDHRICAMRELEEETGLIPEDLLYLGCLYPSPGFCDEIIYLYLARGLRQSDSHPDEDEFLEVRSVPFGILLDAVMRGEICDAKTVALALKTSLLLNL